MLVVPREASRDVLGRTGGASCLAPASGMHGIDPLRVEWLGRVASQAVRPSPGLGEDSVPVREKQPEPAIDSGVLIGALLRVVDSTGSVACRADEMSQCRVAACSDNPGEKRLSEWEST